MRSEAEARVVVLTPVKDEAWVLDSFLRLVSRFADRIVVADQASSDNSVEICRRHPKVHVIRNPGSAYDEAARQRLLIEAARAIVPGKKVLVALDADEVPIPSTLGAAAWSGIRRLVAPSALYLRKFEAAPDPLRHDAGSLYPLGFVDDGRKHGGAAIHSQRVPVRTGDPRREAPEIAFLHLACLRVHEYRARQAYYSMLENVRATKPWLRRASYYSPRRFERRFAIRGAPISHAWRTCFRTHGLDLDAMPSSRFNAFHDRCLELLAEHGSRRFWWDEIWWEDWESAAEARGVDIRVERPPAAIDAARGAVAAIVAAIARAREGGAKWRTP